MIVKVYQNQKASHPKNDLLNGGGEVKTSFNILLLNTLCKIHDLD